MIDGLEALGISYDDVVEVLEAEGVDKFDKSWAELVDTVEQRSMATKAKVSAETT